MLRILSHLPARVEEGGMEQTLPQSPEEESTLPTPWFWTSGLQNGGRIDVLSHLICHHLLQQPKEISVERMRSVS